MKRMVVLALVLNAALLGIVAHQLVARAGDGEVLTAEQNGDVNGDARLDMSDAVYLLINLFNDGPDPVEMADSLELAALRESFAATQARLAELEALGGCTDSMADNFDVAARIDDGSCEYRGCTDPAANNYDPIAEIDDGSCDTPIEIEGFSLSTAANAQGYAEYTHGRSGHTMVLVPGGTFLMGAADNEAGAGEDEGPRHEVTLTPFLIGKYEVSWSRSGRGTGVRGSCGTPRNCVVSDWCNPPQCPEAAIQAPWYWCNIVCEQQGLSLPSEAQWEYACRAGTETPYSFGDRLNGGGVTRSVNDEFFTAPGFGAPPINPREAWGRPNGFGLLHMHGNVSEWCLDVYDADFYSRDEALDLDPVARIEDMDPSERGFVRTVRGGGRQDMMEGCRSARREGRATRLGAGFRPVFNLRGAQR